MSETKATRLYPLRVPENLMELAETKSRTESTDRATALRQLLYAGAEGYAMEFLAEGRISSGKAGYGVRQVGLSQHPPTSGLQSRFFLVFAP